MAYTGPTASVYPGTLDSDSTLFGDPANFQEFTLESYINASATTVYANESVASCEAPLFIRFASGEMLYATGVDTGSDYFTIQDRGVNSTAAEHLADEVFRTVPAAQFFSQLKNAIIAIETELGTDPAGSLTDVKTRLAVSLNDDGTLKTAAVTDTHIDASAVTQHAGVADGDLVLVDDASLATGDVAFWTANGLEGKPPVDAVAALDEEIADLVGDMVGGGSQQTGITVTYDAGNYELDFALDFGMTDNDVVQVDATTAVPESGEYARWTADGLEGRSSTEAKSDLGFISELVDDSTPELAADLDAAGFGLTDLGPVDFGATETTAAGQTSVVWTTANNQKLTLTSSPTIVFTAPDGVCHLQLKLIQDGSGNRTVTWPGSVYWPNGVEPTLSTGSGDIDLFTFWYDGSNYLGSYALDYS